MYHIAFCLLFIGSVHSAINSTAVESLSICHEEGFKCIDACTKLVRCVINGNRTYTQQVVRNCPSEIGRLCNLSTKDCSSYFCNDEKVDSQPITCYEDGIFPNPSVCTAYYSCSGGVLKEEVCPKGTAYNGAFGNCTINMLDERPCMEERPIPKCTSIDDIGSYKENSSIYYVCAYNGAGYLLPELRRCQNGFHFDVEEKRCNSAVILVVSLTTLLLCYLFVTVVNIAPLN